MKRLFLLALALLLACTMTACDLTGLFGQREESSAPDESASEPAPEPEPDPATPDGSLMLMVGAIRVWDVPAALEHVAHLDEAQYRQYESSIVPFEDMLKKVTARLTCEITGVAVDGDTAVVDVSMSAVSVTDAAQKLVGEAAKYYATESLKGGQPDLAAFVADYLRNEIDPDTLPSTTSTAKVHMIRTGDGTWLVDASSAENMDFLDALTGGAVSLATQYAELLAGLA